MTTNTGTRTAKSWRDFNNTNIYITFIKHPESTRLTDHHSLRSTLAVDARGANVGALE